MIMSDNIHAIIKAQIERDALVLYMKGTPDVPMCGFSAQVVHVLNHYNIPYQAYNVLEDDALREGIKSYTDWPTIPQLYCKKTFLGGCDIILQMHQDSSLAQALGMAEEENNT
jgi:monothiol glutaredoxin